MAKIERILVPVDFSDTSLQAFEYAKGLAAQLGSELHLVHVYQLPTYTLPDGAVLAGPDVTSRIMDESKRSLDELAARSSKEGITVKGHLTEGLPHKEVERIGDEIRADLIVMGTHGRTGLSHFLLGSVAERVVRTSKIPVLTVRQARKAE